MPVLGTKVRLPAPRRPLVERRRLTALLQTHGGPAPRLVLVAAPAGFGKTTLLAQWLASSGESRPSVAWLALDSGDRDVHAFLTQLVAAIQVSQPAIGAEALALLDAGSAGAAGPISIEAILISLVNDLDVLAGPTVLALDDYHVIDTAAVHEAVTFVLDNLPPHVTLAITTRADPPLPLSRLRARGELVEIRAADLRFTGDEATTFLNEIMGLGLEAGLIASLETRTEGWAAGLQLAAVSARSHGAAVAGASADGDVAGFVAAFSGSHRFVLDYLVEEVLERQPADVRSFLLRTSVLDQLTGDLCDALTGRADGQAMLELLERENLFVVALDDERRWYRYHHLFADALRSRLVAHDVPHPPVVAGLHAAAARWLAEHGLLEDAVGHALAGPDQEYAADLVELGVADLRRRRQDRTLRDWLAALPPEVLSRRPLLATDVAWTRLSEGDPDGVERWLDIAEAALRSPDTAPAIRGVVPPALTAAARDRDGDLGSLPAMIAIYRASVAQARGDVDGTVDQARRALALAGPDDHFIRGAGAGFVGLAAWAAGDLRTAVDTFGDAVVSLHAAGMIADELGGTVVLADMWLARGRPDEARRQCERALAAADRHLGPVLSTTGDLHVALADLLREQGALGPAADHLRIARELGDAASLLENRYRRYVVGAALLRAEGDLDGAVALLDRAEPLFRPGYFPEVRPIAATRARIWIQQHRLDAARTWARGCGIEPEDPPGHLAEYAQLTLARLLIAEGNTRAAIGLLDRALAAARSDDRTGSVLEVLVSRALARQAAGQFDGASEDLSVALVAAVPVGYSRLFLDEGPPMTDLLERVAREAPAEVRRHAETLLASAPRSPAPWTEASPGAASPSRRPAAEEALSERELEVLRLLATDLSGPEIARRLYVSVNTLRTHTKHIFTKLDVNTRRAAVRRAAELGLL